MMVPLGQKWPWAQGTSDDVELIPTEGHDDPISSSVGVIWLRILSDLPGIRGNWQRRSLLGQDYTCRQSIEPATPPRLGSTNRLGISDSLTSGYCRTTPKTSRQGKETTSTMALKEDNN